MRSSFCVPRYSIEGTTGPNWLKFCMRPPRGITRWITEGFLDIRSGGPDMGYPRSPRGGPKILKICFPIFSSFSTGMGTLSSKSLVYVKISASFNHFNVQGGVTRETVFIKPSLKIHKPCKTSFLSAAFYFYV